MNELPFVGVERRELVARLLGVFDEVVSSGSPRLVTLEADSGWGKSRLVQELYGRLAAERQESGFWPASILGAVSERDLGSLDSPDGRRKRIFPASFEPPVGAVPEWLWWGISATARQGGSPVNALAAEREQVDRFRVHLVARLVELNPETPWAKAVRALRSDGSKEAGWEAIEEAIAGAAGAVATAGVAALVASTPVGFLLLGGRYAWKHREALGEGLGRLMGRLGPEVFEQRDVRGELVAETASALGDFASGGIPVVLVLEDAHQADETLIELLVQVLQDRRGPVMIVATAWPGTLEDPARWAHRLLAEVPTPSVVRFRPADLPMLEVDERVGLIAALLPDATPEQQEMLAGKWSNPLALELGCRLRMLVQMLEDGELTEAELASLPGDPEGLYQAMWKELPEELREALMLAVLATPETASEGLFDDRQWDVAVPRAAAEGLDWLRERAEGLQVHLTDDATAYDWVRWSGPWLQACHESVHHHVATTAAFDSFTPTRRTAYFRAIADAIVADGSSDALSDEPADRLLTRARMLAGLAVQGVIDWTDAATAAADVVVAQLAGESDAKSLRALVVLADAMPVSDDEPGLDRRLWAANALGQLGEVSTAIDRIDVLLNDSTRVLGADHPNTSMARCNRGMFLWSSGRVEEAISEFSVVLESDLRVLGADHQDTLTTRRNLAVLRADVGCVEESIGEFRVVLEDARRVFGPDDPKTHEMRGSLSKLLDRSGRVDEAISELRGLLGDQLRVFGADHRDTLLTRYDLLCLLANSDQFEEAVGQLVEMLEGFERGYGSDNPDALAAMREMAGELAVRVIDAEHPGTPALRIAIEHLLRKSGRVEEADALLRDLDPPGQSEPEPG